KFALYICQIGDSLRIFATADFNSTIVLSKSSFVVYFESEKRMLQSASSAEIPIAVNTCDGSRSPETQAEPDDTAILVNFGISSTLFTCLKTILLVLHRRVACCAWIVISSISLYILSSK